MRVWVGSAAAILAVLLTYVRLLKSFPYLQKSKMSRVPPKPPFSSDSWI